MPKIADYRGEVAARIAESGSPVLPLWWVDFHTGKCGCGKPTCPSPGKHPVSDLVPDGKDDATTDLQKIRGMWRAGPWNIGRRLDQLLVVDCDIRSGFQKTLKQWVAEGKDLPPTYTMLTGRYGTVRGLQLIYKLPQGIDFKREPWPGVEIKYGDKGYVVAAWSFHFTGEMYLPAWGDVPYTDPPAWLIEHARKPATTNGHTTTQPVVSRSYVGPGGGCRWGRATLRSEAEAVRNTGPGGRDNRLCKAAKAVGNAIGGGCLDRHAAEGGLYQAATDNGEVADKGTDRVWTTIRTNIDDGMTKPRSCGNSHPREVTSNGDGSAKLGDLMAELRSFMDFKSEDYVLFALAVAVSAKLDGDALWGMLVGASSGGKTEIVLALNDLADEHPDELTPASLLSWMPGKGKKPGRVVGMLTRLPEKSFVTLGDFSTVLASSDRGMRDQLFALLRRVADGKASRNLGQIEQPLTWEGRLTALGACTAVIDNYSAHANSLGPRWLYYRLDQRDLESKRKVSSSALTKSQLDEHRAKARELAAAVVVRARQQVPDALPDDMNARIADWAVLTCYGRAGITRDTFGAREIAGFPEIEDPPRVAQQLQILARCLLALEITEGRADQIVREAALSSIPQPRRKALELLVAPRPSGGLSTGAVARALGCSRMVARFALEDLAAVGMADWEGAETEAGGDQKPQWATKDWFLTGEIGEMARNLLTGRLWA